MPATSDEDMGQDKGSTTDLLGTTKSSSPENKPVNPEFVEEMKDSTKIQADIQAENVSTIDPPLDDPPLETPVQEGAIQEGIETPFNLNLDFASHYPTAVGEQETLVVEKTELDLSASSEVEREIEPQPSIV